MKDKKLRAGIFVSMSKHSENFSNKLQELGSEYELEDGDKGNNNFRELDHIKIGTDLDWDALLIVLRKAI